MIVALCIGTSYRHMCAIEIMVYSHIFARGMIADTNKTLHKIRTQKYLRSNA